MSESDKVGNLKNNPPNEKLEIRVKTFFGHEITVVEESGDYKVKSSGIKGLGDKILWFIYAPTLKSRQAAVEESLKNNNGSTNDKRTSSNIQNVQSLWQIGNSQNSQFSIDNYGEEKMFDDPGKTNQFLSEKKSEDDAKKFENSSNERLEQSKDSENIKYDNNAHEENSSKIIYDDNIKMADNPDDSNFQLLSNEKDSIGNQTNINNDNRNNSSIKERESERRANNEISENSNSRRDKNINDIKGITNEKRKESSGNIADGTRSKFDLLPNNEFIKKDNDIIPENLQSKGHIDDPNKEKTFNDLVNSEIEQAKNSFGLSDKECNEIRKIINDSVNLGFENPSVIKDTIDQFVTEKFGKQDVNGNINSKGSIKSDSKINENVDNEFSIFNNKDNKINFVNGQNSARTDVNNMCHNSSILSKEELNEIEGQINDLRKVGDYTEETLALLKQNLIEEAIEKKKSGKENLEYQRQLEKVIEQSKSESENTDKRYKEAENNLKKIIPEGYRVTSFDKGDEIIGDGNCFYRAIAKLENGNQEEYGDVRKKIFDEIGKYCPESNEEQAEKIDNNLKDLIENYAVENKLECSLNEVDDLLAVLIQIREHVGNADNKNRYAGHIEAYFYAKATKNAVIIYDSIGQMTAFIPDKEGKDMQVKSLSAKETEDQQKIENFVKNNSINVAAAVKLACNTVGPHYEAIVPVDVKN